MKYLKLFENYNNLNDVKGEIEDIEFILQDLKDNGWIVNVDLVVKRWENPAANFHIKSDYIKVYIKKTDCKKGSRYPLDAEFNFNIIEDEIRHILSIYKDNEINIKMCLNDTDWEESLDKQHIPRRDYLRGIWSEISTDLFIKNKLICCGKFAGYSYNTEILGIELKIYLETENIDQIKEHSYIGTWAEPNSPIRHEIEDNINFILSELNEGKSYYRFHVSWTDSIPYVWIAGALKENGIHRYKPIFSEVEPIVKSITAYLKSEGFQTEIKYLPNKENCRQFYIYFMLDNINESFDIDEDSEHLKDLALDLTDEGDWSVNVYTNTEKYNEDEYSCKVILEPIDEFDWDAPGINDRGGQINDTLIQYLENIIRYMEDYEYNIILASDNATMEEEIILNSIEEFKKWIEQQLKHQPGNIMTYGYKKDLIIIEFYEKDDLF